MAIDRIHLPLRNNLKLPVDLHITWKKEMGKKTPDPTYCVSRFVSGK